METKKDMENLLTTIFGLFGKITKQSCEDYILLLRKEIEIKVADSEEQWNRLIKETVLLKSKCTE